MQCAFLMHSGPDENCQCNVFFVFFWSFFLLLLLAFFGGVGGKQGLLRGDWPVVLLFVCLKLLCILNSSL